MFAKQPRPARLTKLSTLLLDSVDGPLQAVDLGHVTQLREEVLQALEVVVQAAPPHVDHRNVVVLDRPGLGLADARRGHQQVGDLRLRTAVPEIRRVDPDATVTTVSLRTGMPSRRSLQSMGFRATNPRYPPVGRDKRPH